MGQAKETTILHLLEVGFLEEIDLYFADMHHPQSEAERAFLAAAMQAARDGHICLDLHAIPAPQGPYQDRWTSLVRAGLNRRSPYLKIENDYVYLQKNYQYETDILWDLKRLIGKAPLNNLDDSSDKEEGCLNNTPKNPLSDEQQKAVDLVRQEKVSIIAGGPGTGKTYLTSKLVKSFGSKSRVILAAPTGKATARLKEQNPHAFCSTLHALLGMSAHWQPLQPRLFLQADLIVIDEASMLDAKMMRLLLKSLSSGQKIVFLGDENQLPPIEVGSLFCDLIDLLPTAHLKTIHRSDRKEILNLAQVISEGKVPKPHHGLTFDIIREFSLSYLEKSAILTPLREGPWGVKELNLKIDRLFHTTGERATPIMITRNDQETGLCNGEMGLLISFNEKAVWARFQIDGKTKEFPASALPSYELAYVLSVHKSQGSEFDHVLILAPPGTEQFGKELLYTAVTRARRSILLIGDENTLAATVKFSSCRRSGIKKRWMEVASSKKLSFETI